MSLAEALDLAGAAFGLDPVAILHTWTEDQLGLLLEARNARVKRENAEMKRSMGRGEP